MINKKLAEKINKMAALDQKMRKKAIKTGNEKGLMSLNKKNTAVMKKNSGRIENEKRLQTT